MNKTDTGAAAGDGMGPLRGVRIVEFAGIGPGPYGCMVLADMGAELIRIDRLSPGALSHGGAAADVLSRGRRSVVLDLKKPEAVELALELIATADAMVEGFRPGVMEKLGLGPEPCQRRNPRLVYARMTGWGQQGPLAAAAGHDINYIALTGALAAIGRDEDSGPVPPLNLLGDFGGGSMFLVAGVLAALLEAKNSGRGQVVDVAIVDGVASLMASIYGFAATGLWDSSRGSNMLDGGAPFYDTYQCSDGKWISIGSIEPQFYRLLAEVLEADLGTEDLLARLDKSDWSERKQQIAEIIRGKSSGEWCALMEGSDICFAPVLTLEEAPEHPHNRAREIFVRRDGVTQPAPAPRFSRTRTEMGRAPVPPGADTEAILAELGKDPAAIESLRAAGAVG